MEAPSNARRLAAWLFIVLPTGAIDTDDGIKTELITSELLQLSISWPPALLDAEWIMTALLSFSEDLCDVQGPLLAQGIRSFTDPLHSEVGEDVTSTCTIPLPFPVEADYDEDVIKFKKLFYHYLRSTISGFRRAFC